MNYTLHQLKVFVFVVKYQSVTRASQELFLTQPAVSIQLKKLQEQFDIPLTEVIGRKLYITEFGKKIARISEGILEYSDQIRFAVNEHKGLLTGEIKVAVVSTGKYIMPYLLKDFVDSFPSIEMNMDVTNKNKVIESLINNKTDFALVSVIPDDLDVISIPLMKNHLFLVGNSDRSVKSMKKSSLEQLPLIYRENGSATRQAMEGYFDNLENSHHQRIELVSNEAVKQAVSAGLGYSIMPLIGLKNELKNKDLSLYTAKGLPIVTQWSFVYLKGKQLSPAAKAFADFLVNSKEEIIDRHFAWCDDYIN